MTPRYAERIIAHELGHALGIFGFNGATGHSRSQEDVMFSYAPCDLLSLGDVPTIRRVYTDDAYYRPASTSHVDGLKKHVIDQ
jgi:predicted Zn-dependent protease